MTIEKFRDFLRDEEGSYTIWFLTWFAIFIAVGGFAVDIGNAFRTETLLQSTADAAALAAAYSLPVKTAAVNNAITYAQTNLEVSKNGHVVKPSEVLTGNWNFTTRTFTPDGAPMNAVFVTARRGDANQNPLGANFLHIISLFDGIEYNRFNIKAEAIAVTGKTECENEGLIAQGDLEVGSNNKFVNDICLHGQSGLNIQNGNTFELGVDVTTGDEDNFDRMAQTLDPKNNDGLATAYKGEGDMDTNLVDYLPQIIAEYCQCDFEGTPPPTDGVLNYGTDYETKIMPNYLHGTIEHVSLSDFNKTVKDLAVPVTFDKDMVPTLGTNADGSTIFGDFKTYYVSCADTGGNHVKIPSGIALRDMAIISECYIDVGNSLLTNVTLIGLGGGDQIQKSSINFSNSTVLGLDDGCDPNGDVRLYSTHSIHSAADMQMHGVQMIAEGDILIAARADGASGIAAEAGGDIKVTSNNSYGICNGKIGGIFAGWGVKLVY